MTADPLPDALLTTGVLTLADAARHGVDRHRVQAAVRRGELVRLRRGWFVRAPATGPDTSVELFTARSLAASRARGLPMTGRSALAHLGLPVYDVASAPATLAGSTTQRRSERGTVVTPRLTGIGAGPGTARCVDVLEAAVATALHHPDAGLVAADAAVRAGLLLADDVVAATARLGPRPGSAGARVALSLVDGRRESPGESRTALLAHAWGWPVRPQVVVGTRIGTFRVDGVVDGTGVVLEFDGRLKYDGDALFREKRREDAIRAAGYTVVRVVWADLYRPEELYRRIADAIAVDARTRRG